MGHFKVLFKRFAMKYSVIFLNLKARTHIFRMGKRKNLPEVRYIRQTERERIRFPILKTRRREERGGVCFANPSEPVVARMCAVWYPLPTFLFRQDGGCGAGCDLNGHNSRYIVPAVVNNTTKVSSLWKLSYLLSFQSLTGS
jgi:hypothetical protein